MILRLFVLLLIAFGLAKVLLTDDSPPPWEGKYVPGRSSFREWEGGARLVRSFEGVMGTVFVAELEGPDLATLRRADHALWLRVWKLEQTLSTWIPESLLSRVNQEAAMPSPVPVDEDTMNVLRVSRDVWKASGGAFDPTVGPLLRVWKPLAVLKELPSPEEIERARVLVGFQNVKLFEKERAVAFKTQGVVLDVGGVAKGYAAEAAARAALEAGATACRVNAGGDMYAAGTPRGSPNGFSVEVRDPEGKPGDTYPGIAFPVRDGGVATSGNYERYTEIDGRRYSHILDPRTGRPVPDAVVQVTVMAPGGAEADALATALTVMGLERGMALVEGTPGVEAIFLIRRHEHIEHFSSSGFTEFLK